jgi:DNA modification methylase
MAGSRADLCFTDSPYNVDYAGGVGAEKAGKGRRIMNDALGDGFERFLYDACVSIIAHTAGAIYMCMSSSELHTLQKAFVAAGGHWSTFIIWAKDRFTLGRSDYQRQFEPILYGWPEGVKHHWCGARDQGDVWFIDRPSRNDLHPTMKPVGLVERAIRNSSPRGGLVLDPFGGSGTTLIAAERTGRKAALLELDPRYVDVIVQRWQAETGREAVLDGDGRSFAAFAAERSSASVSETPQDLHTSTAA